MPLRDKLGKLSRKLEISWSCLVKQRSNERFSKQGILEYTVTLGSEGLSMVKCYSRRAAPIGSYFWGNLGGIAITEQSQEVLKEEVQVDTTKNIRTCTFLYKYVRKVKAKVPEQKLTLTCYLSCGTNHSNARLCGQHGDGEKKTHKKTADKRRWAQKVNGMTAMNTKQVGLYTQTTQLSISILWDKEKRL